MLIPLPYSIEEFPDTLGHGKPVVLLVQPRGPLPGVEVGRRVDREGGHVAAVPASNDNFPIVLFPSLVLFVPQFHRGLR